jgi:hypothetical protein
VWDYDLAIGISLRALLPSFDLSAMLWEHDCEANASSEATL